MPPDPSVVLRIIGARGSVKLHMVKLDEARKAYAALGEMIRGLDGVSALDHDVYHSGNVPRGRGPLD